MSRTNRVAVCLSVLVLFFVMVPILNAQLDNSPFSGGFLAAKALREGRIQLQPVPELQQFEQPLLTCGPPTPCILPNVQVSGGGQPKNEHALAGNPINPKHLFSGANDASCGSSLQGLYTSSDKGSTWTRKCMANSNGAGDVVGDYDLNGTLYVGGIQFAAQGVITVSISTDNGQTYSAPKQAVPALLGYLADKPWLEVDKNPNSPLKNAIYISATQFAGNSNSQISVTHSNDGGNTWKTVAVDPVQTFPKVDQFSDLAIGPDGTVYLTWQRCTANGPTGDCGGTTATMVISKSTDGGNTWSSPVTIATPKLSPDSCGAFYGCLPNTSQRLSNIPANAVMGSGNTAKVFVTFYNYTGSQLQVLVATSLDGGATWGAPVRVTTAGKDEFFQWINTNKGGKKIHVSWMDRKNDPANHLYQPFANKSADGITFSNPKKLSSTKSNPDGSGWFMGDYRCSVWVGTAIYSVWMDTRTGNGQDEIGGVLY